MTFRAPSSAHSDVPSSSSTSRFSIASTTGALAAALPMSTSANALTAKRASGVNLTAPPNILDRNLGKTRGAEVSFGAWAFLFSEIVQYTQRRVSGISDFEARLSQIGYRVGVRLVEVLPLRDSLPPSTGRAASGPPRQTRLLPVLHYIHTTLFRYLFGRPASSLEKSTENEDEYMIGDDEPVLDRGVQIPKDMSSLSTNSLLAGLVEAVLDGLGFVSAKLCSLPVSMCPDLATSSRQG